MSATLRLFLLAGEPSGDRIGADLVHRLRKRVRVELSGVGGDALSNEGLTSLFDMAELSVMGWADVLPRLPKLLWRVHQVARTILRQRPDVAVLVDSQVFSALVARYVHRWNPRIPVLLCVAPAVWAWKPERASKLSPHFREILSVLPFEPAFMRKAGGPKTSYIGHPAVKAFNLRPDLPASGPLLLLPGSRDGELRRHLPLMRAAVEELARLPGVSGFVLPTPSRLEHHVRSIVSDWPEKVNVVSGNTAMAEAMGQALAAIAVSGTVTLELALSGVPMVVTYVAEKKQIELWLKYKVRFASLPNIILNRDLVPEVLQAEPDPAPLLEATRALLGDHSAMFAQLEGFKQIKELMDRGEPDDPRIDAVERVLNYLPDRKK